MVLPLSQQTGTHRHSYIFIRFLEKDGIYILEIRVDEDGALAHFAEFCKLLHTNGIVIQWTGGYSSDLNGNVEIFNKTLKRGTGALLANAGLKEIFWCYASIRYCNLHNYLSYNHDKSKTAFEAWYGKRPQWNNFRIFGADIYVLDETTSKNSMTKATKHTFLGWGTSTKTIHYLDSKTNEIKRARHVYFDDHSTATDEKDLTSGAKILRNTNPNTPYFDEKIINLHETPSPDPFRDNDLNEHKVDLILAPVYRYGIINSFDEYIGLPFAKYIDNTSPWYLLVPPKFRRNVWIVYINATEPITPTAAYEAITHYSKENKIISVTLSKWEPTTRTKLECYRSQFDQVRSIPLHTVTPASNKENIDPVKPTANFAVYAPTKSNHQNHIGEALSSRLRIEWKKSLWEACDKNAKVGTFTAPFPAEEVPAGHKILNSRITFKVKNTDVDNMYDLYSRHCANGSIQVKGVDYFTSYAAIATADSIRISSAFGASGKMLVYAIDIGNCFQTNLQEVHQRVYLKAPPLYIEWLKDRYPKNPIPPAKT